MTTENPNISLCFSVSLCLCGSCYATTFKVILNTMFFVNPHVLHVFVVQNPSLALAKVNSCNSMNSLLNSCFKSLL